MVRRWWMAAGTAVVLAIASAGSVVADERYEDAVGDALGDAPDIVAVTVGEPEGPVLSFAVEFANEPPLGADDADSDILWIALDTTPEVTFPELDGYAIATLGSTLPRDLEAGSHLLVQNELYWGVVDVAVDGRTVTFRLDRKLLGEPTELYFRVYAAAMHGSLYTDETDQFPGEDESPAHYTLSAEGD